MAITRYNPNTGLTAGTGTAAENAATALTRLRNRNIVNKYTGASVTENLPSGITAPTGNNNVINIDSVVSVGTAGYYVFVNKTIKLESGGALRANANGVHFSFFNCNIVCEGSMGLAGDANQLSYRNQTGNMHTAGIDVGIDIAQNSTRSFNFYGCNVTLDEATGVFFWLQGDTFDTTITFATNTVALPSSFTGSRNINVTFLCRRGVLDVLELYGIPAIFEGIVVDACAIEFVAATVADIDFLLINPQFTDNAEFEGTQQQRFRFNDGGAGAADADATFKCIGFQSPIDNTQAKAVGTGNTVNAYARVASGANGGGYLLMYGWRPEFYEDGGLTGIPGVRVRVANGITLQNGTATSNAYPTGTGTSTATYTNQSAAIASRSTTVDRTGLVKNLIHEYTSDANGLLTLHNDNVRVTRDAGNNWQDGRYVNWGMMRKEIAPNTAQAAFYENFQNQTSAGAGDNVIASPLIHMSQTNFNQYEATYEARSYTHQVAEAEETQNGIVSADGNGATQVADSLVQVESKVVLGATARPNIAAASEADADSPWASASDKSPQQMTDYLISQWAQYAADGAVDLPLLTSNGDVTNFPSGLSLNTAGTGFSINNTRIALSGVTEVVASADRNPILNIGVADTLTFFGVPSTGVNYTAGQNIILANGQSYNGNFIAEGDLTVTGATLSGGTYVGDTITEVATSGLTGVTFGAAGRTVRLETTGDLGTWDTGFDGTVNLLIDTNQDVSGWTNLPASFFSVSAVTVDISADQETAIGGTFNTQGDGTRTRVVGNVTYVIPAAAPSTLVFTHEPHPNGGWFSVFRRATVGTGAWTELITTDVARRANPNATIMHTVRSSESDASGEYRVIWRPQDGTASTTVRDFDFSTFPITDTTETALTNSIPDALLAIRLAASAGVIPAGVLVTWSLTSTNVPRQELLGAIEGTDIGGTPLSGAQSQTLMLSAYESQAYFDLYRSHIATLTGDYILPTSNVTTSGDGQFVQLDTADGQQQNLTAVDDFDSDGDSMAGVLTATIVGREGATSPATGQQITFAAVQISSNPAGATAAQIQGAVGQSFEGSSVANGVGYLVSNEAKNAIDVATATEYDEATNYRDNL